MILSYVQQSLEFLIRLFNDQISPDKDFKQLSNNHAVCRKGDEFRCIRLFNRKSQVGKPWVAIQLSSPQQLTIYTIYQHVSVKIMETHTDNSLICNLITSSEDFLIFTDTRCLCKCSMISCIGVFVKFINEFDYVVWNCRYQQIFYRYQQLFSSLQIMFTLFFSNGFIKQFFKTSHLNMSKPYSNSWRYSDISSFYTRTNAYIRLNCLGVF